MPNTLTVKWNTGENRFSNIDEYFVFLKNFDEYVKGYRNIYLNFINAQKIVSEERTVENNIITHKLVFDSEESLNDYRESSNLPLQAFDDLRTSLGWSLVERSVS